MTELDGLIAKILSGEECVVSYPGISQYTQVSDSPDGSGSGSSACGLASFNCARIALIKERNGLQGIELLNDMVKLETFEVDKYHKTRMISILMHLLGDTECLLEVEASRSSRG